MTGVVSEHAFQPVLFSFFCFQSKKKKGNMDAEWHNLSPYVGLEQAMIGQQAL